MATESGAASAAAAAAAAAIGSNVRRQASDAQHLVGNSGRGDTLGGRHQHERKSTIVARFNRLQQHIAGVVDVVCVRSLSSTGNSIK